jgi:hypothetical protein
MTDRDVFAATRLGRHVLDAVGSVVAHHIRPTAPDSARWQRQADGFCGTWLLTARRRERRMLAAQGRWRVSVMPDQASAFDGARQTNSSTFGGCSSRR